MHYFYVEDETGSLIDFVPFCSDYCHRQWCETEGETYGGWSGCHEGSDYPEDCETCGTRCWTPPGYVEDEDI